MGAPKGEKSNKPTDKQEMFCREYLIDLNATQAAIRAGYSENTAMEQGSRLLSNVKVQEMIVHLKSQRSKTLSIEANEVLSEIHKWFMCDVTQFINMSLEELKTLPSDVRRLITGFKAKEDNQGNKTIELTFVSKEKAADMIAKHINFFEGPKETDKKEALQIEVLVRENKS